MTGSLSETPFGTGSPPCLGEPRLPSVVAYAWLKREVLIRDNVGVPREGRVLSPMPRPVGVVHDGPMNDSSARRVVDALITERLLDPSAREQSLGVVTAVLQLPQAPASGPAAAPRRLPQLVEVVAYLGGALVLAAGVLFLAQEWDGLGYPTQVTMLAVVTAVLGVAGAAATRTAGGVVSLRETANDSRRRLSGTLLTGAALAAAFLVGLVVDHGANENLHQVYWPAVAGGALGLLVAAVGYRMAPTALGMLGMLAALVTALVNLVSGSGAFLSDSHQVLAIALTVFLIGAFWLALAEKRVLREVMVARAVGVLTMLVGAQMPVMESTYAWFGYLLTLALAVGGITAYLRTTAWPYLAVAVGAVTLVVPEAVSDWTEGSLGAIGAVLVTGVTLLLASFAGYRIRAGATESTGATEPSQMSEDNGSPVGASV